MKRQVRGVALLIAPVVALLLAAGSSRLLADDPLPEPPLDKNGDPIVIVRPIKPEHMPPSDPSIVGPDAVLLKGVEEPDTSRDIDFARPVPRDIKVPIGGAFVTVPKGGVWTEGSAEGPGGVEFYSIIELGDSRIVIDPTSLTVVEEASKPEAKAAFDRIREELEAQR